MIKNRIGKIENYGLRLLKNIFVNIVDDNGIAVDLSSYSCVFGGYETKKIGVINETFNNPSRGFRRIKTAEKESEDEITVTFLFVSDNHENIIAQVRKIISKLQRCKISISSEPFERDCVLKGDVKHKFITWTMSSLEVTFSAICYGNRSTYNVPIVNGTLKGNFQIDGSKETPIDLTIIATENTDNFTVNINSLSFTVSSLNKNDVLIINSSGGKVLLNGNNAIDKTTLIEFPILMNKVNIECSTPKVSIQITYRSRW